MKSFASIICAIFFGILLSGASAKTIDLARRVVPFQVLEDNVLSGSLESRHLADSAAVVLNPEIAPGAEANVYALLVPTAPETNITVTINGRSFDMEPLRRSDGLIYMVDPMYLKAGQNSIQIERTNSSPWAGLSMFSLRDSFEEAHFNRAFGDLQAASELAPRDTAPSALQTNYDVLWYDCTWKPSMTSAFLLSGSEITMGAKSLVNGLTSVDLDFDMNTAGNGGSPMVIDYLDSGPGTPALSWTYSPSTFRITVQLPAALANGSTFTIRTGYHGAPNNDAPSELFGTNPFYSSSHNSGRRVVYSVSQPYGGRRWWPSKDHPSDKATTTIQRIIVPTTLTTSGGTVYPLTAISNGVLESTVVQGSNTIFTWRNDHPIATYLMSLAVTNYTYAGGTYTSRDGQTTMPVGHWIYPENAGIEGNGYAGTIQAMNFFADKFGEYPFLDQKYQTATWNISYAIEHQTCTSMPDGATVGVGNGLTRRNIHELSHQWFGDKVTCANWDHVWLHEGMATYCEALMFEHLYGEQYFHDYVNSFTPSSLTPVVSSTSDQFSDGPVYDRGAWVFHMLRHVLGDDAFFAGCRAYINSGYTTAVSQPPGKPIDFQSAMEQGAGLSTGSLQTFFTQWLYSPNTNYRERPQYNLAAPYYAGLKQAHVTIQQKQGLTAFEMPVDVMFTDADSNTTTVKVNGTAPFTVIDLGDFVPATAVLDPDNWILKTRVANINTASLADGQVGVPYSFQLQGTSDTGGLSWQKVAGDAWLNVSSSGLVSGVPPATGTFTLVVRLTSSAFTEATFELNVKPAGPPPPAVVINEVLYENSQDSATGTDNDEFVELLNTTTSTLDLGGWQVLIVDASGEPTAASVTIPADTMLAPGDYYVLGNQSVLSTVYGSVIDLNTSWLEALPDASPGAVILKTNDGTFVDSLAYRSDVAFGAGSQAAFALAERGTGRAISAAVTNTAQNVTLGRLPDGRDTGNNLDDFASISPSPGAANMGIALPFFDDFNAGVRPEWRSAFENPVHAVTLGSANKPPLPPLQPPSGAALEVYDPTGGGDVTFLSGDFNKLNVEGYIWIPQNATAAWSTGIGLGTRVESAWFSGTEGFALEHGFYLEYENGTNVNLKGGRIANAPGQARLLAANSYSVAGIGNPGFAYTSLGTPVMPSTSSWQPFRLFLDGPANRVYAKLGNSVIYDGAIPLGLENVSGGVAIGFRENHSGNPSATAVEGTWVDNITVNSNTSTNSEVSDYSLY